MLYLMLGILFAVIACLMILVVQGENAKEETKAALTSQSGDAGNCPEDLKDSKS